jgi:hypothetical protein
MRRGQELCERHRCSQHSVLKAIIVLQAQSQECGLWNMKLKLCFCLWLYDRGSGVVDCNSLTHRMTVECGSLPLKRNRMLKHCGETQKLQTPAIATNITEFDVLKTSSEVYSSQNACWSYLSYLSTHGTAGKYSYFRAQVNIFQTLELENSMSHSCLGASCRRSELRQKLGRHMALIAHSAGSQRLH